MKRLYWVVFTTLLVLLIVHPVCAAEPREVKRVLILHSEGKDNQGQQLTEKGIREVLLANQSFDIKLYIEFLEVSRFFTPRMPLPWPITFAVNIPTLKSMSS